MEFLDYFWLHWVLIAPCRLFTSYTERGRLSSCEAGPSHCGGFFCCRERALDARASAVLAGGLQSADSVSCGTWAQLLRNTWNLAGPGIKYVSPALAGGFLSTVLPGKSWKFQIIYNEHSMSFTFFFSKFLLCSVIAQRIQTN